MLARVCGEASFSQVFFVGGIHVGVAHERRIELLAQGKAQVTDNTTLRTALGCSGELQNSARHMDGVVLHHARQHMENAHLELVSWVR